MSDNEESFDGTFSENTKIPGRYSSAKKSKFIINVQDTQYAVVKHVAKKNKWNLNGQPISSLNFDLCWTDNHVRQQLFAKMQSHQKINHFPGKIIAIMLYVNILFITNNKGMTILSRKNNLGKNLMLFKKEFEDAYDFFPITWTLPYDYPQLLTYHQSRKQGKAQTFIVKPQASCQGRGIFLTRNIDKLKNEKCVIQRYMHKPFLIDGLKFDLRIYVLVAGIDPLRIFVYQEGLARFATEPYKPPRSQNLQNMFMHLTNYAINKQNPDFIFNESIHRKINPIYNHIVDMDIGHKRSLTSVYKRIAEEGHDVQALKKRINDIFIKTIITGYPTLSNTLQTAHPDNFANDMCFEILGFDVILDHKLNPTLLEINYTPSFTTDTPLDRYIKKNLISDTFSLLNINEKWKKQMRTRRDQETQDRIISGKRRKYTHQDRIQLMIQEARKRDIYEIENMGGFTKIFVLNQQQLLQYMPFYDYAMHLYGKSLRVINNQSILFQSSKQNYTIYHHYFTSPLQKKKKDLKDLKLQKLQKQKVVASRLHEKTHQINEPVKRVASAKNRNQEPRSFKARSLQRKESKKSLIGSNQMIQQQTKSPKQSKKLFHNKNLQNIFAKLQQGDNGDSTQ